MKEKLGKHEEEDNWPIELTWSSSWILQLTHVCHQRFNIIVSKLNKCIKFAWHEIFFYVVTITSVFYFILFYFIFSCWKKNYYVLQQSTRQLANTQLISQEFLKLSSFWKHRVITIKKHVSKAMVMLKSIPNVILKNFEEIEEEKNSVTMEDTSFFKS
jgi:hypothetical protein